MPIGYSEGYSEGSIGMPGLFGVKGGWWGTGVDRKSEIEKTYQRLLSPAEFEKLDPMIRSAFGAYMNYVNAFTSRQKATREAEDAYRSATAGTFEPESRQVSYRIPERQAPKTTVRTSRDIYGRTTRIPAGAGVRTTIKGRTELETPQAQLAVPTESEMTLEQLATQEAKRLQAQAALGEERLLADLSPIERHKLTKAAQAADRIAVQRERIAQKDAQYKTARTDKEYFKLLDDELRQSRMKLADKLKGASDEINHQWQLNMAIIKGEVPGTKQANRKIKDAIDKQLKIIDAQEKSTMRLKDYDDVIKQGVELREMREWVVKREAAPGIWDDKQELEALKKSLPSASSMLTRAQFESQFQSQYNRAPTPTETERAYGKYWR